MSTSVLSVRVSDEERALLEAASEQARTSLSDFIRRKALDASELKREGRGEKPHQQIASALQESVAKLGQGDGNSP